MVEMNKLYYRCAYLLAALLMSGCMKDDAAKQAFFAEDLNCPPPAIGQFDPWGESGSEHTCKINHGPFVAFENGYVHIRGQFDNGKKVGIWRYYDKDGKVDKEVDYSKPQ